MFNNKQDIIYLSSLWLNAEVENRRKRRKQKIRRCQVGQKIHSADQQFVDINEKQGGYVTRIFGRVHTFLNA